MVPTTRPRHQVTETPAVSRALDRAAKRWPGESRGKLLLRLLDAGDAALGREDDDTITAHRAAVRTSAGAYPEAFGQGYLDELRGDWPA